MKKRGCCRIDPGILLWIRSAAPQVNDDDYTGMEGFTDLWAVLQFAQIKKGML